MYDYLLKPVEGGVGHKVERKSFRKVLLKNLLRRFSPSVTPTKHSNSQLPLQLRLPSFLELQTSASSRYIMDSGSDKQPSGSEKEHGETTVTREVLIRKKAQKQKKAQPWRVWAPVETGKIDPGQRFEKPWYDTENDSDRNEGG